MLRSLGRSVSLGITCVLTDYMKNGEAPVAPSAIAIKNGQVFAPKLGKMVDYPVPRALDIDELPGIIKQTVQGARNALAAGGANPTHQC